MNCQLAFTAAMAISRVVLPPLDENGRIATLGTAWEGHFGFADSNLNERQVIFKDRAIALTANTPDAIAIDMGTGFGHLAMAIVSGGGRVAAVDASSEQMDYLRDWHNSWRERVEQEIPGQRLFHELEILEGYLPYRVPLKVPRYGCASCKGRFEIDGKVEDCPGCKAARGLKPLRPYDLMTEDIHFKLYNLRRRYHIPLWGASAAFMYLSPQHTIDMLFLMYESLDPGGEAHIYGPGIHNNLFPGWYDQVYVRNREIFDNDPEAMPFPHWIPDIKKDRWLKHIKFPFTEYLKKYPRYFNSIDPEILEYHARQIGFEVHPEEKGYFSNERYPKTLQATKPGVTALSFIVLRKPANAPPSNISPPRR